MRIAILGDALDVQYAGIHVFVRELVKAVTEADRENEYFIVRPKRSGEFADAKEIVVPIHSGLPGSQRLRLFTSIPRRLEKEKMDVVVEPAHFGPFNLPSAIKRVTIIHDLTPILFPQFHPFSSSLFHRLFLPGILKRADGIILNSQKTRRDVESHYPVSKGKTHVVLPGRENGFVPRQEEAVLQKYGIRLPYLLFVGTLEPRKNLLVLLEAFEQFRQQSVVEFQLVLAGKPGWRNKAFFDALERSPFREDILMTGYVERQDLPVLYSMAKAFVYPSLYEGFGLPVLEAMSCGAPVLISNTSSLPEVGGPAACYFDPRSASDLAEKLADLLSDKLKREKMSRQALQRAELFSWEQAAQQFVQVIKEVARLRR